MASHPWCWLKIWIAPFSKFENIDFLYHYPNLEQLLLNAHELKDASGLRYLKNLKALTWKDTRKKHSLSHLKNCTKLTSLTIRGHDLDFETVGTLKHLQYLFLYCAKLDDLSALVPLKKLKLLDVSLGSIGSLEHIPRIGKIEELELCRIRQITQLDFLEDMTRLKKLTIRDFKQIRRLPSFKKLKQLKYVHIWNMDNLESVAPIAAAPRLEKFMAWDMKLPSAAFQPFVGHPALKYHRIGLGSMKRNQEVDQMLGLSADE